MSSLDKMWVSFGSMGFMFAAMLLMMFINSKIENPVIAIPLKALAWILLILGFVSMLYIIFNPTKGSPA